MVRNAYEMLYTPPPAFAVRPHPPGALDHGACHGHPRGSPSAPPSLRFSVSVCHRLTSSSAPHLMPQLKAQVIVHSTLAFALTAVAPGGECPRRAPHIMCRGGLLFFNTAADDEALLVIGNNRSLW